MTFIDKINRMKLYQLIKEELLKRALLCLIFFLNAGIVGADTVLLKDGRVISGTLIQNGPVQIIIKDERGMINNFYKEQVENVVVGELKTPITIDPQRFPNIDPQKLELLIRLTEVNGTSASLQKNIEKTINNAPPSRNEELRKLFDLNEIIAEIIPVYDRYFTQEDLLTLVAFYESPAGKKMIKAAPEIIEEATQASLDYFEKKLTPPSK